MEPAKDTESQVQAKAPGGRKLDLIVVQGAIREHVLLNGCLHGALWREGGRFTGTLWLGASRGAALRESCRGGSQHTDPVCGNSTILHTALEPKSLH